MREVNYIEFETGDVLKFKTEQGTYKPEQIIIVKRENTACFSLRIIGNSNPLSWGSDEWLAELLASGDIEYMGNIGNVS